MDNPIFEEYIQSLHSINPTINDYFMRDEWNNKKHIQPNIYSEKYYKELNKINKVFLQRLKNIDNLSFYEKILKKDMMIKEILQSLEKLIKKFLTKL